MVTEGSTVNVETYCSEKNARGKGKENFAPGERGAPKSTGKNIKNKNLSLAGYEK